MSGMEMTNQELARRAAVEVCSSHRIIFEGHEHDFAPPILRAIEEAVAADRNRLDWMQSRMFLCGSPEIYLAGLRSGIPDWNASSYQVEVGEFSWNAPTLREAIDKARAFDIASGREKPDKREGGA